VLVWVVRHATKAFGNAFGVAILATGADFRAAGRRVPRNLASSLLVKFEDQLEA
jgi:hypothetical protein